MWCGEVQRRDWVDGQWPTGDPCFALDGSTRQVMVGSPTTSSINPWPRQGVVEWYCRVPCCDRMTILAHTLEKGCGPKSCAIPPRKGPVVDIVDLVVGCCIVHRKARLVQVGYCD